MIVLVTTIEHDEKTKREKLVVSHGVDMLTGKTVILPCDHPKELGARFDTDIREYVIDDHDQSERNHHSNNNNLPGVASVNPSPRKPPQVYKATKKSLKP